MFIFSVLNTSLQFGSKAIQTVGAPYDFLVSVLLLGFFLNSLGYQLCPPFITKVAMPPDIYITHTEYWNFRT